MSGLSGFWTVYLKKPRKIWTVLSGLSKKKNAQKQRKIWAVYLKKNVQKPLKSCAFFFDKPLKTVQILRGFWAVFERFF